MPKRKGVFDRPVVGRARHIVRIVDSIGILGDPGEPDDNRKRATEGPAEIAGLEMLSTRSRMVYVIDAIDILSRPPRVQHAAEEIRQIRMAREFGKGEQFALKVWLVVTKMDALADDAARDTLISRLESDRDNIYPPFSTEESVAIDEQGLRRSVEHITGLRQDQSIEPHITFVSALSVALDEFGLESSDEYMRNAHQMLTHTRPRSEIRELEHLLGLVIGKSRISRQPFRRDLPSIMRTASDRVT